MNSTKSAALRTRHRHNRRNTNGSRRYRPGTSNKYARGDAPEGFAVRSLMAQNRDSRQRRVSSEPRKASTSRRRLAEWARRMESLADARPTQARRP